MKVFLDSVGCRLNTSEIQQMARTFLQAGAELTPDPSAADLIVINTCTVTAAAAADSRSLTRRLHKKNPRCQIALTGCWSTLQPQAASSLPGVGHVIPNQEKDTLPQSLLGVFNKPLFSETSSTQEFRLRTRAFIKVQDGCDSACTFCITTVARGESRSIPVADVVREVRSAVETGAQEVILTGVSLSSYGRDLDQAENLASLLKAILSQTSIHRIRLSSIEPWGLSDEIFELLTHPRICRQLHLPLQSGSPNTLRRMCRPISPILYAQVVDKARTACPELALTTDLIVGFPGETQADFHDSCGFVSQMDFADAHIFSFSSREGTPAARIRRQITPAVKQERSAFLRAIIEDSAARYRARFLGNQLSVLWITTKEWEAAGWRVEGISDNSLRVQAVAPVNLWNQISDVTITESGPGFLTGLVQRPEN